MTKNLEGTNSLPLDNEGKSFAGPYSPEVHDVIDEDRASQFSSLEEAVNNSRQHKGISDRPTIGKFTEMVTGNSIKQSNASAGIAEDRLRNGRDIDGSRRLNEAPASYRG